MRVPGFPLFIANLAAFITCATFAFARNINALFYHYDGSYMLVDARDQLKFGQPVFDYTQLWWQQLATMD